MNVGLIQARLNARVAAGLKIDGSLGAKTYAAIFRYVGKQSVDTALLGAGAALYFPIADILSPLRLAHFLGQASHESSGFRLMREMWGPTPEQARYDGRLDLGNKQAGDGYRFRGRGLFQITGRANYDAVGRRIGRDLVGNPALAEDGLIAVQTACDYWTAHRLAQWADADDGSALSRAINRGNPHSDKPANGEAERAVATARAKELLL